MKKAIAPIAIILLFIAIAFLRSGQYSRNQNDSREHKKSLISELNEKLSCGLNGIWISPYQQVGDTYKCIVEEKDELSKFIKAAKTADEKPIGSHNGPIYESILVLKTNCGELKYIATVQRFTQEDLYISNIFWTKSSDGSYHRENDWPVRIPNLGSWIVKKNPKGILGSRDG